MTTPMTLIGTVLQTLYQTLSMPQVVVVAHAAIALTASGHAVMTKDEPRAAVGWVGLIWLSPIIGSVLYYLLGINRIRRKAVAILGRESGGGAKLGGAAGLLQVANLGDQGLEELAHLGDRVIRQPLCEGNAVRPLVNGDIAYPAMLAAIHGAKASIMLASYIFDYDDAGREFIAALGAAVARGVEVRVLIDATGSRYSFPSAISHLKKAGVQVARFMPNLRPLRMSAVNLRSHRKILVIDGCLAFTGGMNIRQGNYTKRGYKNCIQDVHFQVEGPVVSHLRQAFIEDWMFTTKELLAGEKWQPALAPAGSVLARGIPDGPDRDFEKILWMMLGAISTARKSVRIITPYFLPDPTTMRFLSVASMSGIQVEIILPERNNIRLVQWASMAILPTLARNNVHIYLSPPPFDHTKMLLIDDAWACIGSANWDARSLRLNFEFNIEIFCRQLTAQLNDLFAAKKAAARPLTALELFKRPAPLKLRDGVTRLLAPYL